VTHLDALLAGNARFAATDLRERGPAIPFVPNRQLYLVTCIDPRVDPAAVFGLELGDAIVARTVGGRVTDDVLDDLAWIGHLHAVVTPDAPWFAVAVVHHTGCGSALMADDALRSGFLARGARPGWTDARLRATAVTDPHATAAADAARLRAAGVVPGHVAVGGFVHDLATGVVTPVAPDPGPAGR
jgi:carbonic anhydrase